MRRGSLLVVAVAAVAGLVSSVALGATRSASAPNGNTQKFDLELAPTALARSRPAPVSMKFIGSTTSTTEVVPVPATEEVFDFDKSVTVYARGLPTCRPRDLQSATPEEALAACRKAKIGAGTATAVLPLGEEALPAPSRVLIFNGKPRHGLPTVLLYSQTTVPVTQSLVLVGTFSRYDKQGYGLRLSIPIPPLAGGIASLADSVTLFNRRYDFKGKKRSFLSASCARGTLRARGTFTFSDSEQLSVAVKQRCKPRR